MDLTCVYISYLQYVGQACWSKYKRVTGTIFIYIQIDIYIPSIQVHTNKSDTVIVLVPSATSKVMTISDTPGKPATGRP